MKWWIKHAIIGTALAGCVAQDATQPQIESTELSTCPGPGNYPNAKLPPIGQFDGTVPVLKVDEVLISMPAPDVQGVLYAFVANPTKGTIRWAVEFKPTQLASVHWAGGNQPWLDIIRVPPTPHPIGSQWLATYTLNAALVYANIPNIAGAISQ